MLSSYDKSAVVDWLALDQIIKPSKVKAQMGLLIQKRIIMMVILLINIRTIFMQ